MTSGETPVAAPSARQLGLLLAATLFALGLRLWGLDHLLPHRLEPDRQIPQQVLVLERGAETAADRQVMTKYPWLLAGLATLGYEPPHIETDATPRDLVQHRRRASSVTLRVRLWVALLGTLAVPLTWWIARGLVSERAALLAAALLATSLLHHDFSQQARAHVPAATFVLLTLGCAARAACAHAAPRAWLCACVAAALALGTLHSGVAAFLPLAAAAWRRRAERGTAARLVLALLAFVASLLVFYPFLWGLWGSGEGLALDAGGGAARFELRGTRLVHGTHMVDLARFDGGGFAVVLRALWTYDPWLLGGLAVGLLAWLAGLARRASTGPASRAVVLAYALPYLLVIGLYLRSYQRFALPLLPLFAILASFGWCRCAELVRGRFPRLARWSLPLALGAILLPAAATGCRLSWLRSRADSYERLAGWIEAELDPERDRLLVVPPLYLPPLFQTEELAREDSFGPGRIHRVYWSDYQSRVPHASKPAPLWPLDWMQFRVGDASSIGQDPLAWLRERGGTHVAVESLRPRRRRGEEAPLRRALREGARLVLALAPDGTRLPLDYNEEPQAGPWTPHHALRLWRASCVGTVIDVYALDDVGD